MASVYSVYLSNISTSSPAWMGFKEILCTHKCISPKSPGMHVMNNFKEHQKSFSPHKP